MNLRLSPYVAFVIFISLQALRGDQVAGEWGAVSNEVQMSIGLNGGSRVVGTNEEFQLLVRVRNLSGTNVWSMLGGLPNTDLTEGVHCEIASPSGKDISPNVVYYDWWANRGLNIPPHKTTEFVFRLSDICKFDEVGTYKIVASKAIGLGKHKGWVVVSNPLHVTVVSTNSPATNGLPASSPK